jgi:tight adherence protein B
MTWRTTTAVAVLAAVAVLVWPIPGEGVARLARPAGAEGRRRWVLSRLLGAGGPRRRLTRDRSRDAASGSRELVTLLEGLAGALRAGLTPVRALAVTRSAVADGPDPLRALVDRLAAASAAGGPLAPVWRGAAERLDSPALHAVAEAWGLTERHGAPVVDVLDTLVAALRDQARTEAAVATALAAPRATAALLGALPLGGVVLGELVGVHPVSVLLGTPAGRVAGAMGLVASLGGRLWMRRLVASVLRA